MTYDILQMMILIPKKIQLIVEKEIGHINDQASVIVGDSCQAAKITVGKTNYFIKWAEKFYPGMFKAEARGLELIERTETLKVPEVVLMEDTFLVLEYLELSQEEGVKSHSFKKLGKQLAQLHRNTSPLFGLANDNYLGTLPQDNKAHGNWTDFFWGQRIKPQMEIARRRDQLSVELEELLEKLYVKLPNMLPDRVEASLIHGDLWKGNVGFLTSGEPVVFDPAASCSHREMDLAMTELFGGLPQEFYDAYNAEWPLESGYKNRKQLYQLYPLLAHFNLFGGVYEQQVLQTIAIYTS
jgi:fructosamine-3-kinase